MKQAFAILFIPLFALILFLANIWGQYSVPKDCQAGYYAANSKLCKHVSVPRKTHRISIRIKARHDDGGAMLIAVIPPVAPAKTYSSSFYFTYYKSYILAAKRAAYSLRGPPVPAC